MNKIIIGLSFLFLTTLYYHENADNSPIIRSERNVAEEYYLKSLIIEDGQIDTVDILIEKALNIDTVEEEIKREMRI